MTTDFLWIDSLNKDQENLTPEILKSDAAM